MSGYELKNSVIAKMWTVAAVPMYVNQNACQQMKSEFIQHVVDADNYDK